MRTWGLVASASMFSAAIAIAALSGCGESADAPARVAAPPPIEAPPQAPIAAPPQPVAEPAFDGAPPPGAAVAPLSARPSFLIRFESPHPIAPAHAIAADNRMSAARSAVWAGLRARRELDGLCYKGFTLGGAEVVLEACSDVADPSAFEQRWVRRFATMRGVDYAEPNRLAAANVRP